MARIRTIKPEFPHSESIGRLSRDARLLFILLWTLADDSGRLRGNSRVLSSLLYPYDNDASGLMDAWLTELEAEACIARYTAEGNTYVEILHWKRHQKIDHPSVSKLPSRETVASPREDQRDIRPGLDLKSGRDHRSGMEREGSGKGEGDLIIACPGKEKPSSRSSQAKIALAALKA